MKTHFVQFLACYSKKNDSIYQHETIFFEKIRYLFLTYQRFVFCLVFSKYFFENMGFFYTPLNGLWTHIQMVTNGKFITQRFVYNVKSLALTLSFPQAFKDAATER